MSWAHKIVDQLAEQPMCGYAAGEPWATEPTALAVLALLGHDYPDAIEPALELLRRSQRPDGSVPVRFGYEGPAWTTSLAILAWRAANRPQDQGRIDLGANWIESIHSKTQPRHPETGHDTTLDGWPWVENTHAWLEPTAFQLLALRASGRGNLPRAREAVALLIDRQLPAGGANYGNTTVFGQVLLAHQQPTGIALLALAGEADASGRIGRSIGYLRRSLSADSAAASLAWSLIGLAAQGVAVPDADPWLEWAAARVQRHDRSPHKLALLALAALGSRAPALFLAP